MFVRSMCFLMIFGKRTYSIALLFLRLLSAPSCYEIL